MAKSMEGSCGGGSWRKHNSGNKYRAGNDDGSRKSRTPSGKMSSKHHTANTHAGMTSHKGNPY